MRGMKKLLAVLLLAIAGFAAFIGSPLLDNAAPSAGPVSAWQVVRYTLGCDSIQGANLFAADMDGDGAITLQDALLIAAEPKAG